MPHRRRRRYVRFHKWMLNGHSGDITWRCKRAIVRGINRGLVTTSTRRGPRYPGDTSYHVFGRAVDMAGTRREMLAHQRRELRRFRRNHNHMEILGPDNRACVLRGVEVDLTNDSELENQHDTHVHVAF